MAKMSISLANILIINTPLLPVLIIGCSYSCSHGFCTHIPLYIVAAAVQTSSDIVKQTTHFTGNQLIANNTTSGITV